MNSNVILTLSVAWSCCCNAKHISSMNIRANLSTLAEIAIRSIVIVTIKANMSIILRHLLKPRPCLIEWLCCPVNQLRWLALWLSLVVLQATVSTRMWMIGWWVESHIWNDSSLTFYLAIALLCLVSVYVSSCGICLVFTCISSCSLCV